MNTNSNYFTYNNHHAYSYYNSISLEKSKIENDNNLEKVIISSNTNTSFLVNYSHSLSQHDKIVKSIKTQNNSVKSSLSSENNNTSVLDKWINSNSTYNRQSEIINLPSIYQQLHQ